jgi:hypothetical protein
MRLGSGVAMVLMLMVFRAHAGGLLHNTDLSSGSIAGWNGDGHIVYLNAEGVEGEQTDPGVTPVIKLSLSNEASSVYQDVDTRNSPTKMDISVEVMGSTDFRRSKRASDYQQTWTGGTWMTWEAAVPTVDFWIRLAPAIFSYKLANIQVGSWTTVTAHFTGLVPREEHTISFYVPPGEGAIYLKNPTAN